MTEPEQLVPTLDEQNEEIQEQAEQQQNEKSNDNSGTRYVVKCPWYHNELIIDENLTITPQGVEVSGEELERAIAGAKESHTVLKYKEV